MEGQRHASVALPAATTAPRDARHFTVETLQEWGVDAVSDEAELIVSELVTIVVRTPTIRHGLDQHEAAPAGVLGHGVTANRAPLAVVGDLDP